MGGGVVRDQLKKREERPWPTKLTLGDPDKDARQRVVFVLMRPHSRET